MNDPRTTFLRALFVRAAGRRVFGFDVNAKANCAEAVKGKVDEEITHVCVEGDSVWLRIPSSEIEQNTEAA